MLNRQNAVNKKIERGEKSLREQLRGLKSIRGHLQSALSRHVFMNPENFKLRQIQSSDFVVELEFQSQTQSLAPARKYTLYFRHAFLPQSGS